MKRLTNPHTDLRALIEAKEVFIQSELLRFRKEKSSAIEQVKKNSKKRIEAKLRELEAMKAEKQRNLEKLKRRLTKILEKEEQDRINLVRERWLKKKDNILTKSFELILPDTIREDRSI